MPAYPYFFDAGPPGAASAGREILYGSLAPLRGAALEIDIGVELQYFALDAVWFYGAAATDLAAAVRKGHTQGEYISSGGGHSKCRTINQSSGWYHYMQGPDSQPDAQTWTVGLLNRTISSGHSIEYDPVTGLLSLAQYGAVYALAPNLGTIIVYR